jgi:hypothetical protein
LYQTTHHLSHMGHFDYAFWTDGSLSPQNHLSAAACYSYSCNGPPLKHLSTIASMTAATCITGLTSASFLPEIRALTLPTKVINLNPSSYTHKRLFIGTDSQSSLASLNPLKRRKYAAVDPSETLAALLHTARKEDATFVLQWIPSHVGLPGNTACDFLANECRTQSSFQQQVQQPLEPSSLKSFLVQHATTNFHKSFVTDTHHHHQRFLICGISKSHFRDRQPCPRALQCLFSRWRLGKLDSCGTYSRIMNYVDKNTPCRFCSGPTETPLHLLVSCPGTTSYRVTHGLSLATLQQDTPVNLFAIATFDTWISQVLPFPRFPMAQRALALSIPTPTRKRLQSQLPTASSQPPATKRRRYTYTRKRPLVILTSPTDHFRPKKQLIT